MRTYTCPKCSAIQENMRMPPKYLWSTAYIFRCQNCATMLRLAPLRRRWVAFPSLTIMLVVLVTTRDIPSPAYEVVFFTVVGGWACA
ncbi:MAG: hypothetical protein IAG10_26390, partial [Planctomycetaceae bacterium]|nr:hypothetical protein [Planctomycetaceae bacterium]